MFIKNHHVYTTVVLTACLLSISGCRPSNSSQSQTLGIESISIEIPVRELSNRIVCSEDVPKAIEILNGDDVFLVHFKEFVETPIIHNKAICQTVLTRWFSQLLSKRINNVKLDLVRQSADARRPSYTLLSPELLNFCLSEGVCARNILDYRTVDKSLLACQPRQSWNTIWQRMRPKILKADYQVIPKVEIHTFPITTFTQQIEQFSKSQGQSSTFVSTMTIGSQTARKLSNQYNNETRPIFLALDAGVSFGSGQMLLLTELFNNHSSIFPLPITSGIEHKTLHHWKLALNTSDDESILTSLNLSTPEKTTYTDFIYKFDDPAVTAELRWLLWQRLESACHSFEDYRCFVDFAYSNQLARSNLYHLFENSCAQLSKLPKEARPLPVRKRFFLQPQDTDLEHMITNLIASAKYEVIILTHKLTVDSIVTELARAQQRGVRVVVITTEIPPRHLLKDAPFIHSIKNSAAAGVIPEPHMKLMIIDRTELLFGTGNFSNNALRSARELFAITDDKEAITAVLRVVISLTKVINKISPKKNRTTAQASSWGLGPSTTSWVVLANQKCHTPPCDSLKTSLPHTIRHSNSALLNYRQIHPEMAGKLSGCSLNEALFISEENYRDCLKKMGL